MFVLQIPSYPNYYGTIFLLQNNLKKLDPSYKMVILERGKPSFSLCFRLFEKHKQYEEMQQNCTDQSNRIDDLNDLISDLQGALAAKSADVER